jgi:hypothetical protein
VVPAKTANRALAAPALPHILGQTVLLLDKKLHQILAMMQRFSIEPGHPDQHSDKCNANFNVGSPYRAAGTTRSVEDDIEAHWNSICRGNLQARTRIRKISNGAIKLWRFVAEDNLRGL